MRKRDVKEDFKDLIELEEVLCKEIIKKAHQNPSPLFTMTELNKVLKNLKNQKCKDPANFVYDLFQDGVVVSDLRNSIIMLVNQMKVQKKIPEYLRTANVRFIHKSGNKVDLNNCRGISVTSVVRQILMNMILNAHMKSLMKI